MGFLHSHQIIHRDIKPQNILLLDGRPHRYVLTDLGYANKIHEAKTICGTPGYMAPEILTGEPYDAKSDIFSMGVVGLEIRGMFKGIQDEVRALPEGWTVYQRGRLVAKRISQVNAALVKGKLSDKEGWYKLLVAMTQPDWKARPTALQALDILTSRSSAYPAKRSTVRFEPLAECRSEDPKANLDCSKATAQRPPAEKRHLVCDPAPTAPGCNNPIYKDVMARPLQVTEAIRGPGFRTPIQKFRSRTNGLRQPLQTNINLARLTNSPYSQKKPEVATMHELLKPADDRAFSKLNAPKPNPNKGNGGRGGNPTTDSTTLSNLERSAKKTSTRHGVTVPACLKAQHSRFDRSKIAKKKHRERQKMPGAWCVCRRVSCGGKCSMYKPDAGLTGIFDWYLNGKETLVKRILAFFGSC